MLAPGEPLVSGHDIFGQQLAESLALCKQIRTKTDPSICGHETISVASDRPLNILHMGLISKVEVWCFLLNSHWCQAMPIFSCYAGLKVWHFGSKSGQKLITAFAVMKPYQLPPDPWISPIYVWWVKLRCVACTWIAIGVRPWQFWTALGWKFGTLEANQDQNSSHLRSWNHISCLQTLEYPPYGSDK
jgi:hypothetical protein